MSSTARLAVSSFLLWTACATSGGPASPDETSAEGHRQEAEREWQRARELEREAAHRSWEIDPSYDPDRDRTMGIEPANDRMNEAERRRAHAHAHLEAAAQLERFESGECAGVAAEDRAACPLLGPVTAIHDIRGGVRVEVQPGTPVVALVVRMRCHLAFARTRGFSDEAASCPLYVRGIRIRLSADGKAVEILGTSLESVSEVRKRVRQEAVRAPAAPGAGER
jgi:hypothetical protein